MEDLIKRTTIEFPGPLNLEQTEDLLGYIARELPANINYKFFQFRDFFYDPVSKGLEKKFGIVKIGGDIRKLHPVMPWDNFSTISSERDVSLVGGLRFNLIHDCELKDCRKELVELWDDVREKVYGFFDGK